MPVADKSVQITRKGRIQGIKAVHDCHVRDRLVGIIKTATSQDHI